MAIRSLLRSQITNAEWYDNFLAGNAPAVPGGYFLLETTTLTSSASSVSFTGLGSYTDYKHLQIRMITRTSTGNAGDGIDMIFNSDTSSSYAEHRLQRSGSSVASSANTSQSAMIVAYTAGDGTTADAFGGCVLDILDFSSTSKNTTVRSLSGDSAHGGLLFSSGLYFKTDAITSIELTDEGSDNFVSGSRFSLYGISG